MDARIEIEIVNVGADTARVEHAVFTDDGVIEIVIAVAIE